MEINNIMPRLRVVSRPDVARRFLESLLGIQGEIHRYQLQLEFLFVAINPHDAASRAFIAWLTSAGFPFPAIAFIVCPTKNPNSFSLPAL